MPIVVVVYPDYSTLAALTQMNSLACALLTDPDLLLLDEPTIGLDPVGMREVRELILELVAQGKAIPKTRTEGPPEVARTTNRFPGF